MHRKLHQRLRDLRLAAGFRTQKHFVAYAHRRGQHINERRYGQLERGEVKLQVGDVVTFCGVLNLSADALLFADDSAVVVTGLGERGKKSLMRIVDEIRFLERRT